MKPLVDSGKLVAIGVVIEQHPDRALLYRQWRDLKWPLFCDSLGLLDLSVVPVPIFIDANGVVRGRVDAKNLAAWVDRSFEAVRGDAPRAPDWDVAAKKETASLSNTALAWRVLGDATFETGGDAVAAYERATTLDPKDARAWFRLGVARLRRSESAAATTGDAQAAVDAWTQALALEPGQYIWRRRLQQYGPRLAKPYNFYGWIEDARRDLIARKLTPLPLVTEPFGSEVMGATTEIDTTVTFDPDPLGQHPRDGVGLVKIAATVVPRWIKPGERARVRLTFELKEDDQPYWNNEGPGLRLGLKLKEGFRLVESDLTYSLPSTAETREKRQLGFEIEVAESAPKKLILSAYALYEVCEGRAGICRDLRQDFTIEINVSDDAPTLKGGPPRPR